MLFDAPAVDWTELHRALSEPFPAEHVAWRAGSTSRDKKRAMALPYAEPRVYEDRLNRVAPGAWECAFRPWGENRIICELTIFGVTRASTGEFDPDERGAVAQGTSAEAQAFKRACSKFGLGRYLYEIPIAWVDYDAEKRRLSETPALPARFLPSPEAAPERAARPERAPAPARPAAARGAGTPSGDDAGDDVDAEGSAGGNDARLGSERAEAMRKELEKLGVRRVDQGKFAGAVLGRRVRAFTELSEAEAGEVWHVARRSHRDVA